MSKYLKRIKTLILFALMFTVLSTNAFAAESTNTYWEDLSERAGIPVEDLQNAYSTMTEEEFGATVQHCIDAMDYYKSLPETPSMYGSALSESDWIAFKQSLVDGSVLLTTDSSTYGFEHGHASIISGAYSMELNPLSRVFYVTEHPGKNYNNKLSWRRILHNQTTNYWRTRTNIGVLNSSSSSIMAAASAVGNSSVVLNKPYAALALKNSTSEYNCSSLVYRCYINSGLDISKSASSIVLPIDIAQNTNLTLVYEYGNFSWR